MSPTQGSDTATGTIELTTGASETDVGHRIGLVSTGTQAAEQYYPGTTSDLPASQRGAEKLLHAGSGGVEKGTGLDGQVSDLENRQLAEHEKAELGVVVGGKEMQSPTESTVLSDPPRSKWSSFYMRYRILFHLVIWLFFTG